MTRARDIADSGQVINSLDNLAATLTGVELNLLDGATITTTELNYLDGVTSDIQTQIGSKADGTATTNSLALKAPLASPTFTGAVNASGTLQIGGVAITSTPAELNKLDGVTASTTEINYLEGVTSDIQPQITAAAASGGSGGDVAEYKVTSTFTAPVFFKKVDIIPNNITVAGTWELFADSEVHVSELTTISSNDEYLVGTASKSNHIWYKTLYIGDDSVITVTDTMQGLGPSPLTGEAAAAEEGLARTDFSATDAGGLGSFSYNNTTGVSTYTGPSLGKLIFLGGM